MNKHIFFLICIIIFTAPSCEKDYETDLRINFKEDIQPPTAGIVNAQVKEINGNKLTFSADFYMLTHQGTFIRDLSSDCISFAFSDSNIGEPINEVMSLTEFPDRGDYSVLLLIDQSGSMSEEDPSCKRVESALTLLELMTGGDEAAMATFAGGFDLKVPFSKNYNDFVDPLNYLCGKEGGGTNLFNSAIGLVEYLDDNAANLNKIMVILTDGQDSNTSSLQPAIDEANARDIDYFTVGFGGASAQQLGEMAFGTGGIYMYVNELNNLASQVNSLSELMRGEGEYYTTCWTVVNNTRDWQVGDIVNFSLDMNLPDGKTAVKIPITLII